MIYTIKSDKLTAQINSHGAELVHLIDENGIDRLHDVNHDSWKRTSPILFPQISRTRGNVYNVKGKEYQMPMHGFFRDLELTPYSQKNNEIIFKTQATEESLKHYPYQFEFYVKYLIFDNRFKVEFKVINPADEILYFMVGGHPGFKLCLNNHSYEDYKIVFQQKETADAMQVADGYLANEFKQVLNNEDTINLKHNLFVPDAIVLKDLKSKYVDIVSNNNDFDLRFYFADFAILAIWANNNEDDKYVCLEPWNGIQKQFVKDHEKMGVLSLNPHDTYVCSYTIEIVK